MQFPPRKARRTLYGLLALVIVWAPMACRKDASSSGASNDALSRLQRLSMQEDVAPPSLTANVVVAGAEITLDCAALAPKRSGLPALFPEAAIVRREGTATTFAPTQAGSYITHCIVDRDGSYAVGPTLQVLPGTAQRLTLALAETTVAAGAHVGARCSAKDSFGNAVALPEGSSALGEKIAFVVNGVATEADADGHLPLNKSLVGAVEVRCKIADWPHVQASEPVTLNIEAAPFMGLTAQVDGMFYGPHEPIAVRCTGTDVFGNERPAPDALVQVVGAPSTINGQSFFADRVGLYQVVCIIPEAEGNDGSVLPALVSPVTAVSIAPGPPARWQVRWHATGACLSQTTPLPLTWRMFDAFNNPLDFYDVQLVTEPRTKQQRNAAGGFTLSKQGRYSLHITPVGPGTQNLPTWHKDVVVNSTPPEIVVTSPERAAMIESNDNTVMFTGYIKSAFGPLARANINGIDLKDAPGQESVAFSVPVSSRWGLNLVQGSAEDVCGNEATLTQSFLHSHAFTPVATGDDENARVLHAVRARFGQDTWDDHDPNTLQDVATLMQMALESSSLEDRLPHFLGAYPEDSGEGSLPSGRSGVAKPFKGKINGLEVYRDGPLAFAKPTLEYLHTNDGGWDVAFNLEDLTVPFLVKQFAHWGIFGSGVIFTAPGKLATRRMRVEAHIDVCMKDGEPRATVAPNDVHITFAEGAPQLNLSLPFDHWLGGSLEALMMRLFSDVPQRLVPIIEARVRKEMVGQIDLFLAGLQLHHSLPLPPPFETTLQVRSGLDHIQVTGPKGAGYGDFGLYTQILAPQTPLQAPRHAPFILSEQQKGAIRRAAVPAMPLALHGNQSFALAVHDDLLNQMLWSLWAGGAFSRQFIANGLNADEENPAAGNTGRQPTASSLLDAANHDVFFMSPPVVMPSANDNEIVLAIGDVWARAELMPKQTAGMAAGTAPSLQAGFFFSTIIRAHIDIDAEQGHLVLTPIGVPELYLQVNPVNPPVMTSSVQHWLSETLKNTMPRLMSETLKSFPLPQLAIGRIPGVPPDAVWVPDNGTLDRPAHGAEVMFQGTLRGARSAKP